ncbi:MAG: hypothetical protein KME35_18930 [Aphanocapsa sp. GSE-SYN-MK-11-07L]|nr:hypothetical protein [Aphanocapsa sp. GSE-SYN-MK-11-07L]
MFEMYAGSVMWDGQARRVKVNASETESLVGMGLRSLLFRSNVRELVLREHPGL